MYRGSKDASGIDPAPVGFGVHGQEGRKFYAVRHAPRATSPVEAVRASIAADRPP